MVMPHYFAEIIRRCTSTIVKMPSNEIKEIVEDMTTPWRSVSEGNFFRQQALAPHDVVLNYHL
jgi:hypothetical protein